ncbi:sulfotransferase [uncultured Marivita sp.]|uniref:sulfotransferase family protein n=1 Tax=uncultured Marivita sp. TaxID=888080 RepID=UPI002621A63B|nr:sulfotransferase [uncultured Marivita sp.]
MSHNLANTTPPPRYCFIAGLHRSGTTVLARLLGAHPDIAPLTCPHVPEDEGAYLQGGIPHTARQGIPGAFAFDPNQHLTEDSNWNSLEVSQRIARDWAPWFADGRMWRLEKSPVNLLRMRLYQQLFPMAHFIIITRHPAAVTQATAKWSDASEARLMDHWRAAHEIALNDLGYLHNVLFLRYEDVCADPGRTLSAAMRFLCVDQAALPLDDLRDGNADYTPLPDAQLPNIASKFGYCAGSLRPSRPLPTALAVRHVFRAVREETVMVLTRTVDCERMRKA